MIDMNNDGNPLENERTGISRKEFLQLALVVLVFTSIIFLMTSLRYMSFLDLNWDLGINMQMLWTTTHGYLLYETADRQTSGVMSFLQVNSAYIAIPIAYIYNILPNAFTLLFIQAFVISTSVIPLFYYSVLVTSDEKKSLLISIVFVAGFAVMSGIFYDFHWEAFLPVEFFTFIYFTSRRRMTGSFLVLLLGSLTLEVFPFMAGSFLLYRLFVNENLAESYQPLKDRIRRKYPYLLLFVVAGFIYFLIAIVDGAIVPSFVGQTSSSTHSAIHSVSYLINFGVSGSTIFDSLEYWLLLFTSLGFVPFLKPKTLVILGPWIYWSVVAYPLYTTQFGVQYGIIAMALLMVPFTHGVATLSQREKNGVHPFRFPLLLGPISLIIFALAFETTSIYINHIHIIFLSCIFLILGLTTAILYKYDLFDKNNASLLRKKIAPVGTVTYFLVLIIVVGIVLGPLNPINTTPPGTGGYSISYEPSPSFSSMRQLTGFIGPNDTVLSTDNLFPFVANNPNAYSFFWYPTVYSHNPFFPYTNSDLPRFLLLDTSEMFTVPSNFQNYAFNTTTYGLRMEIVNQNYPGNIYLFEKGYSGQKILVEAK